MTEHARAAGAPPPGADLDQIAMALQQLRDVSGTPSYGEIAARVSQVRQDQGSSPAEARVGRTTVYDVFRTGRRRLDVILVADIVRALGHGAEAEAWAEASRRAHRPAVVPVPLPVPVMETPIAPPGAVELPQPAEPDAPPRRAWRFALAVVIACLVVNLVGRTMVDALGLPIYLDMAGTAAAAFLLGPWSGALVGLLTNVSGLWVSGPASLAFAGVNVLGGLLWGYGVRHARIGRSVPRFFVLNVAVACACTCIAAPVIVLLFGGNVHHGTDTITGNVLAFSHNLAIAVLSSNLLSSVADKLISGFVALAVLDALSARYAEVRTRNPFGEAPDLTVRSRSGLPELA